MMAMGVAGMGQSNEASTEPRRHPMPNRTDGMASRREQASKAERAVTVSLYLPARRVDEAGREARSHWTAAAPEQIPMTGRSRGEARRERHAAKHER